MPQLDKLTYFSQFFWLCLLLFTFFSIYLMESSGQKRGGGHSIGVKASSSTFFPPNSDDDDSKRKKVVEDPKEGFRSASQTPQNPQEPSVPFLRREIKNVIRSCRRRSLPEKTLNGIFHDLNVETASAEKRVKIAQVLNNIRRNHLYYLSHKKAKAHIYLLARVHDWDHASK